MKIGPMVDRALDWLVMAVANAEMKVRRFISRGPERRSGRIDWTPPAADPSPAPEAPPTPRSASASPFSPGSLAAGSATEDRILDRRSPYLGSDAN